MSQGFNAQRGLILISAALEGPSRIVRPRLAVDTGASLTSIAERYLILAGYDPSQAPRRVRVTTPSGVVWMPQLPVTRIKALGQERVNFLVLSHALPPTATFDGLLGLDVVRGQTLTIDFRGGQISLT
ncbi:MAG: aspartyl protease family protein [Gemmataceae bacterium]